MLGDAADYAADLVSHTRLHLHEPERHPDTAAPGEVIAARGAIRARLAA